jgi:hypothetical protein
MAGSKCCVNSSIWSIAGITVARFGVEHEKNKVVSLKTFKISIKSAKRVSVEGASMQVLIVSVCER